MRRVELSVRGAGTGAEGFWENGEEAFGEKGRAQVAFTGWGLVTLGMGFFVAV